MTDLQKLAVEQIKKLADELHRACTPIATDLALEKRVPDTKIYLLAERAMEIERWAESILDSEEE